mmetsp:Transcript_58276/g.125176  ORF Transcript_58276/g.125176 Transcript_58276/m.125176 type:complete len:317 (-) Transcript_58276:479-1429(-)
MLTLEGAGGEVGREVLVLDEDKLFGLPDDPDVLVVAITHHALGSHPHSVTRKDHLAHLLTISCCLLEQPVRHPSRYELIATCELHLHLSICPSYEGSSINREVNRGGYLPVQGPEPSDCDLHVHPAADANLLRPPARDVPALDLRRSDAHSVWIALSCVPSPTVNGELEDSQARRFRIFSALEILPLAHRQRVVDLPQGIGNSAPRPHGLRSEVALRFAISPPTLDPDRGHVLSCDTIHLGHHVLPRFFVAGHVVEVLLHVHQARVRPDMLRRVKSILREVQATDKGDLAVKHIGLDVRQVVDRGHEPAAGVQHQV